MVCSFTSRATNSEGCYTVEGRGGDGWGALAVEAFNLDTPDWASSKMAEARLYRNPSSGSGQRGSMYSSLLSFGPTG